MCSFFTQRMGDDHGDLADVVRTSGGGAGAESTSDPAGADWKFPSGSINYQISTFDDLLEGFGNPFNNMRDPLLHELDLSCGVAFNRPNSAVIAKVSMGEGDSIGGGNFVPQKALGEDMIIKRPSNMFSRMLQISPNSSRLATTPPPANAVAVVVSPAGIKSSQSDATDVIKVNNSVGCSVENGAVHIPTPRNPGIKRRKSQAKKVVCIPAPAATSSRPGGEAVPSDLWAWRKYGQKPIKGSPYPRGYYRCSSSKGCSARKQVERSRTDPNMLVVTYTSEHNHPWPTQRNALAGSTRSQPLKSNSASKGSPATNIAKPTDVKDEHKENHNENPMNDEVVKEKVVKEEAVFDHESGKAGLKMQEQDFDLVYNHSYALPLPLPDSDQPHDDFFADLGELDSDPFNLIFSQDLSQENSHEEEKRTEKEDKASMDPFRLYDWPATRGS